MSEPVAEKITLQGVLVYVRKRRRQIFVFITCLLISGLLWLMIKLNRDYVHTITFSVKVSGQQDGQRLIALQSDTVVLELKAQGYQLLFNEISMARSLDIDLSKTLLRQSNRPDILYISSQSLLARIATQFPVSTELLNVKPDTLFFRVYETEERRVPVLPDIVMNFQENYMLYDTLQLDPDSVTIRGDAGSLTEIAGIYTRHLDLKQVNKPFTQTLNLLNPKPGIIEMDAREVVITGRVVPAVSKGFTLPVQFPDSLAPAPGTLKTVEVTCKMPVSELAGFNPNTIRVVVGELTREGGFWYGVLSAEAPAFVRQIKITPDRIPLEPIAE